jgi:hypothetical protein
VPGDVSRKPALKAANALIAIDEVKVSLFYEVAFEKRQERGEKIFEMRGKCRIKTCATGIFLLFGKICAKLGHPASCPV